MVPHDTNNGSSAPQAARPVTDQGPVAYPVAAPDHGLGMMSPTGGGQSLPEASGASFLHAMRHRWLSGASLGLLSAAVAVGLVCWLLPARYKAQALVHVAVRPAKGVFINQNDYMSSDEFTAFMKTQTAALRSRPNLEAALRQPQIAELAEISDRADALSWLDKNLEVDTTLGAEILRVSLGGDRPDDVATLLNAIADGYVQSLAQKDQQDHALRIEQLQENYRQYQESLRRKRATLKGLEEQLNGDDPQKQTQRYQHALLYLGNVENQLLQARLDLNKTVKELTDLEERKDRPIKIDITEAAIDEYLRQDLSYMKLVQRLSNIEDQIAQIRLVSKDNIQAKALEGPLKQRSAVQESIDDRRKEVLPLVHAYLQRKAADDRIAAVTKLKTDKVLLEDKVKTLDAELTRAGAAARQPDKISAELELLREEVKQKEEVSKRVADQIELMRVEPRPQARARVLEPAEPPRSKNYQLQAKMAGAAGLGAFGLVFFGLSWREHRSRKIYAPADVVHGLGLNLIGTLPRLPANAALAKSGGNGRPQRSHGLLSEAVDALRAQLLRAADRDGLRVLMVTSAQAGEGKTSLASQLATSLARAWRKTLLIDADLRHPGVHRQFDMPLEPGFSEVLRGEAETDDVIRPTQISRLWMIPAGQCDAHAIQALAQREVRGFLDRLKEQYDFIIVDSSPVLPVADALSLGQHVDAVVLSVLRDVSRLPALQSSHQRLTSLGIRVLGTIVLGAHGEAGSLGYPYPARVG